MRLISKWEKLQKRPVVWRELITLRCIVKNLHVRWRHSQLHDRKLVFCLRVLHQRQPGTGPGKWMAACLSELIPLIFHNVGLLRLRMQHEGDAAWKDRMRNSYGGAVGLKQWFNFASETPEEEAAETLTVMRRICLFVREYLDAATMFWWKLGNYYPRVQT